MYAYIKGKITHKEATHIILETGGLGYHIKISLHTYSLLQAVGEEALVHTYLQIQENAHNLFGFAEISEKKLFLELISVSGVGPNTALVMLSSASPQEIQEAIVVEDAKMLQAMRGIGAKTAQRVILELKDKIKRDTLISEQKAVPHYRSIREEAITALMVLGLAKNTAETNVDAIIKIKGGEISLEEVIKYALKM